MSRRSLLSLAVLAVLVAPVMAAGAAAPFPRSVYGLTFRDWADFAVGSWSSYDMESTDHPPLPNAADPTQRAPAVVTRRATTFTVALDNLGRRQAKIDDSATDSNGVVTKSKSTQNFVGGMTSTNVRNAEITEGEAEFKLAGKVLKCKTQKMVRNFNGTVFTTVFWTCPDVPGHVVKEEYETSYEGAVMNKSTITLAGFEVKQ